MTNLQQLIDRYKDHLPSYQSSVMGFLVWGGKSYYAINSDEPLSLNSEYGVEFITKNGLVEEYAFVEGVSDTLYYADEEKTKEITWDEFHDGFFKKSLTTEEDYSDYFRKHTRDNPNRVKFNYRFTLEQLYPHPWYLGKNISHFEVIRIMPGLLPGDNVIPESYEKEQYYLQYPEFFKPIYK